MDAWAIILITMGSGIAVFALIFWLKQRKSKRQPVIGNNDTMQVIMQSQVAEQPVYPQQNQQFPYPQQNQHVPYPQQAPYPIQNQDQNLQQLPYPNQQLPYPNQQGPYPYSQQNQQAAFPPQSQQQQYLGFIPSTSAQGAFNVRNPQAYYSPIIPANIPVNQINPQFVVASAPPTR